MNLASYKKPSILVKNILKDNWDDYLLFNEVEDYQRKEVEKAIGCYGENKHGYLHYCKNCDMFLFLRLGCNSRICSCCGKRYTDQWSNSLSEAMFKVPHRHIVMSVPDVLWNYLDDWNHRKVYMDAAINAFNDYFSKILRRKVKIGVIVILHPYGKDMKKQPHLHLLITEGAFDFKGNFHKCEYIHANGFRKTWQYHVLKSFGNNGLDSRIVDDMYKKYPKGFYIWVHSKGKINNPKIISKYVGRYVRHPAIANTRITNYDKKTVTFFYVNNEDKKVFVKMEVHDFISALIQHIPPPQFKMIRYYGAYARRTKKKYGAGVQSSINQTKLKDFGFKKLKCCPICKKPLKFLGYYSKDPPQIKDGQKTMKKWMELTS
ncbi:MAG: transposase [Candidatus ainarchaeum sp.]|nr:transposase [Candidatus ainarchaeum sp.]